MTLRLSTSDTTHDDTIQRLIDGATSLFEQRTDTVIITQTFEMTADAFPRGSIEFAQRPVQSVTSIKYLDAAGDEQTLSTDVYGYSKSKRLAYLKSGQEWPTVLNQTDAVTIEYVAGYGGDPSAIDRQIQQAILLMVGYWFYDPAMEGSAGNYDKAFDRIIDGFLRTTYP